MVSVRGGVSNGCGNVGGDILVLGKAVVVVMVKCDGDTDDDSGHVMFTVTRYPR